MVRTTFMKEDSLCTVIKVRTIFNIYCAMFSVLTLFAMQTASGQPVCYTRRFVDEGQWEVKRGCCNQQPWNIYKKFESVNDVNLSVLLDAVCPAGYKHSFYCSCYKFVHHHLSSHSAAKSQCEAESAHLVFIESEEESDFIARLVSPREAYYWIGMYSAPRRLYWENGNDVTFNNTAAWSVYTYNDNSGFYRIAPGNRLWIDGPVWVELGYICEYEGTECPLDYIYSFDESCYKIVSSLTSRSIAKSTCESDSAHLVCIESQEENDFLMGITSPEAKYWFGLRSEPLQFSWGNKSKVSFTNMDVNDPSTLDAGSGCYQITPSTGRWTDRQCHQLNRYICEYEDQM